MATAAPSTSAFHMGPDVIIPDDQKAKDIQEVCEALTKYAPFAAIAAQALQRRPVTGMSAEIVPVQLTINGQPQTVPQLRLYFYHDANEHWQFITVQPSDGFLWEAALFMVGRGPKPAIPSEAQEGEQPGEAPPPPPPAAPPEAERPAPEANGQERAAAPPPSLEGRIAPAAAQGQDPLLRTMVELFREFKEATTKQAEEHRKAIEALAQNMHCNRHAPHAPEIVRGSLSPHSPVVPMEDEASETTSGHRDAPPRKRAHSPSAPPPSELSTEEDFRAKREGAIAKWEKMDRFEVKRRRAIHNWHKIAHAKQAASEKKKS